MCEMAEAVPLCTRLRVKVVDIVVSYILGEYLYFLMERLATERRLFGNIEWEVHGDDLASLNLFAGRCNAGRCQEIQSTNVVVVAPYPGGLIWSTWDNW